MTNNVVIIWKKIRHISEIQSENRRKRQNRYP